MRILLSIILAGWMATANASSDLEIFSLDSQGVVSLSKYVQIQDVRLVAINSQGGWNYQLEGSWRDLKLPVEEVTVGFGSSSKSFPLAVVSTQTECSVRTCYPVDIFAVKLDESYINGLPPSALSSVYFYWNEKPILKGSFDSSKILRFLAISP